MNLNLNELGLGTTTMAGAEETAPVNPGDGTETGGVEASALVVTADMFDFNDLSDVDPELASRVNGAANRGKEIVLEVMRAAKGAGKGAMRISEIEVVYTRVCKRNGEEAVKTTTLRAYLNKLVEGGLLSKPSEMTYLAV